jgi:hypothetical protein
LVSSATAASSLLWHSATLLQSARHSIRRGAFETARIRLDKTETRSVGDEANCDTAHLSDRRVAGHTITWLSHVAPLLRGLRKDDRPAPFSAVVKSLFARPLDSSNFLRRRSCITFGETHLVYFVIMVLDKRYCVEDAFGNIDCYRDGFWYTEVSLGRLPTVEK